MSFLDGFGFGRREVRGVTRGTRDRVDGEQRVVVVGGGLAGVAAACVLAERGVSVTLLEKEPFLGGRVGAWTERLPDGTPYEMERGFHGFFRQYYNLRNLLRRVDPGLSRLRPLEDYPILGPDGLMESFRGLPKTPPLNLMSLLRRTQFLKLRDLRDVDRHQARLMLEFDPSRTYAEHDATTARAYLDSLRFPERGRQMLFDVFSHSFFNPEEGMSAAEMLMMFHFYFLGNPEGLVFDVLDEPFSDALWKPFERYLAGLGVDVRLDAEVERVEQPTRSTWRVHAGGEPIEGEGLVLAVTVPALQAIVEASPDLQVDAGLRKSIEGLGVTLPFAVWRLFLDRSADDGRHPFAGTAGMGLLDNISLYEKFEGESRRWSMRTGGSVVELHAYAVPHDDEDAVRRELREGLHELYPELAGADVLHETWLFRRDCPSFAPRSHAIRPRVATPYGNVVLAGDFVKVPFPTALMERAASSGMLAANHLLDRWDVRGENLYSVPPRGFMA
ncbi:MAG TPA: FAD-dependent oxidoreductase [Sandaracinaceae bacterium LLY-WYZ-13_1]|nr:FAD-dependent oxidoreductase [Sandaracinaceae bacterium LLY-WYZ-13_1]